jgi:signal peptidase II
MNSKVMNVLGSLKFHVPLIICGIAADQLSKCWAVSALTPSFEHPTGRIVRVAGDLFRFRLAYNEGAAFSSRPQDILPFLSPTVFFLILSVVALIVLGLFYRSLKKDDWLGRLGIAMVVVGALGNFIDRMHWGHVVDFIDCDFPDFIMTRWPTFNLADCFVTVGVAVILLSSVIYKLISKAHPGTGLPENGTEKDKTGNN